jgi:predicted phage terminase large subunit-like protein
MDNKWLKLLGDYDLHCQRITKSTIVDTGESQTQKAKRINLLEKEYIGWFEYYFSHYAKKKSAKFHKKLATEIIGKRKIRLLAEIFRSGAKSVHLDMGIPLYLYLVKKELFFMLLIGETDLKAKKLLSDIQAELEYNQKLLNDYGRKMKQGDWADGNFYTTDGIRFMSIGFGMSPRGLREGHQRPDYIVIDDVDTKQHVNNDRIMSESVDYILEEVEGCFDTDSDGDAIERLVYANNNFHKNSITNRLKIEYHKNIEADKLEGIKSDYCVFSVPAVKSLLTFEPTWPEKTDAAYWRRKYRRNSRSFMRNYMHIHVSEGKIFKADYMQHKQMLPLAEYDSLELIGDLSYKDKGDFKAMYLIGKKGREYHIIHSFLRQTSRRNVAKWLYDLYESKGLHNYNINYSIDGLFAQDEFINDFDREGDERGYWIPVIANKKNLGNKHDRIDSIEGVFQRLWVWFNIEEKHLVDQVETIDQFLAFEKGSQAHDDGPDAIEAGFKKLDRESFTAKFKPIFTKRTMRNKRY